MLLINVCRSLLTLSVFLVTISCQRIKIQHNNPRIDLSIEIYPDIRINNGSVMESTEKILANKYPAKLHIRKVVKWMKEKNPAVEGIIYLEGQKSKTHEDSDVEAPFRQRRHFFYLTGCAVPDSVLTYDIASDRLILYIPPLDPKSVMWVGLPLSITEALKLYDVDEVRTTGLVKDYLLSSKFSSVWTITNHATDNIKSLLSRGKHYEINYTLLKEAIDQCRVVKDEYEIALIRKASAISTIAHHAVMKAVNKAKSEQELLAIFLEKCISSGAKEQAYPPIIASGTDAATLHYVKNNQPLAGKQNLLIDAGAEYNCYASDITRTFPISGKFSPESKALYDVVLHMHASCLSMLKEGVFWEDAQIRAHKLVIEGLLKLGILQGDKDEIFRAKTSVAFYPHGLGHYVGLEIHDTGGNPDYNDKDPFYRYLRVRGKLPAGAVITLEPGIYFCRFIIEPYLKDPIHAKFINVKILERYWDVGGIRIEDNILITKTGAENLTPTIMSIREMEKLQATD